MIRRGTFIRWTTLLGPLIAGVIGSWLLSETYRENAFRAWTHQADNAGQWLSGTLMDWLDESYSPLSALAAVAESSTELTESEFLGAYDSVESRASTFFIEDIEYLRPNADGELIVTYTSSPSARHSMGAVMAADPWMQTTVDESLSRFGELVIGPPMEIDGKRYSAVALRTDTDKGEIVMLGRVDFTTLIDSLYQIHVPPGMRLLLEGQFLGGERQVIWGAPVSEALHVARTRTLSGGAELTISWFVTEEFAGGPAVDLARFTLVGGIAGTLGLASFIAMLLWRNQTISEKVTEATAELTESMGRFRSLFEQSSDALLIFGEDGVIDCNEAAVRMVGAADKHEMLSRHPSVFSAEFQPDGQRSADKAREMDAIALREGHHRFDWLARRQDGSTFPNEVSLTPVEVQGRSAMLASWHDLTDRMQTQAELRAAKERADAANQAKSTFLANMSHELRTPMNAILGYSEMLVEEAEELEQDDFIPDLKKINQAGTHLLALINDVLDLSKIESGKMEVFPEKIDIALLIDEVSATAHPLIEKRSNRLVIQRDDDLGEAFQDLTKIRQALLNLLSNAAKFTDHGTITLRVSRTTREGDDWLSFAVCDSGIGIAADKLENIFQEFTQADDSTTRNFGGTGLGLTISRRFCHMLGGDLTVESVVDEGSTFAIEIPATAPGAKAVKTAQPPAATSDTLPSDPTGEDQILVIDDDPEACEIISRHLRKDGFEVVTASSGEQGLQLAHQLDPVAITLDVMMPGMDGWSVLRALKADPKLRRIPVIMMTMIDDRTRGYSLGAVDYLTKPVDKSQLLETLHRYKGGPTASPVLIVEDETDARALLAKNLNRAGWEVMEAADGREALTMMAARRPNLILLDLMMPVMDGFEFLALMRERPEWSDIPVIVLTAKTLSQEDYARLNGSVDEVIGKTACNREQLLERVRLAMKPLRDARQDEAEDA